MASRSLAGLMAIILVSSLLGWQYAIRVPTWNAPDEPAHYNYIKHIATTGTLPVLLMGAYDHTRMEERMAARFPERLPNDWIQYESHQPPLYYLMATPVYLLTADLSVQHRVIAIRLLSTAIGAAGLVLAWLLVRLLFPRNELLPFAVTGIIAFVPMRIAIYAAVENDPLAEVALTGMLVVLVAGLNRKTGWRYDALAGVVLGAALLTKVVAYVSVPLVALAYVLAETRLTKQHFGPGSGGESGATAESRQSDSLVVPVTTPGADRSGLMSRLFGRYLVTYGVAAALSGWWFVRNLVVYGWPDVFGLRRHDAVVAGQPLTSSSPSEAVRHFVDTSFNSFWAQFGWMGITVDSRIYQLLEVICVVAAVGLLAALARVAIRRGTAGPVSGRGLTLVATSALCVTIGVIVYNLTYLQPQGRYFFAALPSIGLAMAGGLRELCPRPLRWPAMGLLVVGLAALSYVCLVRFVEPYFAS